jgi:hypothetical protein
MFQKRMYRRAGALPGPSTYLARSLSYCRLRTEGTSRASVLFQPVRLAAVWELGR